MHDAWFVMWQDGYYSWKFYGHYGGLDRILTDAEPRSVSVSLDGVQREKRANSNSILLFRRTTRSTTSSHSGTGPSNTTSPARHTSGCSRCKKSSINGRPKSRGRSSLSRSNMLRRTMCRTPPSNGTRISRRPRPIPDSSPHRPQIRQRPAIRMLPRLQCLQIRRTCTHTRRRIERMRCQEAYRLDRLRRRQCLHKCLQLRLLHHHRLLPGLRLGYHLKLCRERRLPRYAGSLRVSRLPALTTCRRRKSSFPRFLISLRAGTGLLVSV